MRLGFDVEDAEGRTRRAAEVIDAPTSVSMRQTQEAVRRNPSTDQKKVRRRMAREAGMDEETAILTAMADKRLSLPQLEALAQELEEVRGQRREARLRADETDLADAVIRDHLTPVLTHVRHTAATDWIGGVPTLDSVLAQAVSEEGGESELGRKTAGWFDDDDQTDSETVAEDIERDKRQDRRQKKESSIDNAVLTEAAMWYGRVSAAVKEDADEFGEQAVGMARRVASYHPGEFDHALRTFLDRVSFLHHREAAGLAVEAEEDEEIEAEGAAYQPRRGPRPPSKTKGYDPTHEVSPGGSGYATPTKAGYPWEEKPGVDRLTHLVERTAADSNIVHGWPIVDDPSAMDGRALVCPQCGSNQVTMTVQYGPGGRLGDPGASDILICRSCGNRSVKPIPDRDYRTDPWGVGASKTADVKPWGELGGSSTASDVPGVVDARSQDGFAESGLPVEPDAHMEPMDALPDDGGHEVPSTRAPNVTGRKTAVSLTNVGIDRATGNGTGTDPSGKKVQFRLSAEDKKALSAVLYSDLAVNFSGVDVDQGDIITSASKTAAAPTHVVVDETDGQVISSFNDEGSAKAFADKRNAALKQPTLTVHSLQKVAGNLVTCNSCGNEFTSRSSLGAESCPECGSSDLKRTYASKTATNCSNCGSSIERDPEGEEPRTWHHNDGSKHDHEATPGGDKESSIRQTAEWDHGMLCQYCGKEFDTFTDEEKAAWRTHRREHEARGDKPQGEKESSRRTAAPGVLCYHCGLPVDPSDPGYDPGWGDVQIHERCLPLEGIRTDDDRREWWNRVWNAADPETRAGWEQMGVTPTNNSIRRSTLRTTAARSLSEIAREIKADWKNVYFGAVPYLQAMQSLDSINDNYGQDDAASIVIYFLSNATTWRGETAKRIKAELKAMTKGIYGSIHQAADDDEREQSGQGESSLPIEPGDEGNAPMWPWELPTEPGDGASDVADVKSPDNGYPQPKKKSSADTTAAFQQTVRANLDRMGASK